MDCKSKRQPRQKLLVAVHPDQHIEVFGDNVDVLISRVPLAFSREAEITAEDYFEAQLPLGFRYLLDRSKLLAHGTTRPLLPSTIQRANWIKESIKGLNALKESGVAQ